MNFEDIGLRIKNRRKELKLTQEKLAEKTGLTDTYIRCNRKSYIKM